MAKINIPGINIQAPWSQLILSGEKTIETRTYPLPAHLIGKELAIIETPGTARRFKRRVIGTVVFGESFQYSDAKRFYADSRLHLVKPDSEHFTWKDAQGKRKWGWPILRVKRLDASIPNTFRAGIVFSKKVPIELKAVR